MDVDDTYLPELDDLMSYDPPFEGTLDFELERFDLEADFESVDLDSDQDDIEFMVSI
jgi:hypothetical protein